MVLPNKSFEDRSQLPGFHPDGLNAEHPAVGLSEQLQKAKESDVYANLFKRISEEIDVLQMTDDEVRIVYKHVYNAFVAVVGPTLDFPAQALLEKIRELYPHVELDTEA